MNDIKNFIGQDGSKRKIISEKFIKITKIISLLTIAIDVAIFIILSLFAKSAYFSFAIIIYLAQFSFIPIIFGPFINLFRKAQLINLRKEILLTEFARRNGLNYRINNRTQSYPGIMFNIGSDRKMIDQLLRESAPDSYELSNYQYSEGSGDDKKTNTIGYIMIKLGRKLPHMILDSNSNNFKIFGKNLTNLPVAINNKQKLSLEGDFDKFFTLYAPKEYERDALYIFTPDLMALFIDISGQFDAEIVDDMLFVYSSEPFDMLNVGVMKSLFSIVENVGAKTFSRADKYSDERVGCRTKNIVAVDGQRLKKHLGLAQFLVLIVVFIMFFTIFLGLVGSVYPDLFKEAIKHFSS